MTVALAPFNYLVRKYLDLRIDFVIHLIALQRHDNQLAFIPIPALTSSTLYLIAAKITHKFVNKPKPREYLYYYFLFVCLN